MEHEEIDEEEADLGLIVEELEEDAAFDEMRRRNYAAAWSTEPSRKEIAASAETSSGVVLPSSESVSGETAEVVRRKKKWMNAAEEEAELEEAQAEARRCSR